MQASSLRDAVREMGGDFGAINRPYTTPSGVPFTFRKKRGREAYVPRDSEGRVVSPADAGSAMGAILPVQESYTSAEIAWLAGGAATRSGGMTFDEFATLYEGNPNRAAGPPATEQTDQGTQTVIPGTERSARQAAQAREDEGRGRIRSRREQKDADEGLFEERRDDEPGLFQRTPPDATANPARAPVSDDFPIDATGDVVAGDTIRFTEGVFGGSFRKPSYIGDRTVEAEVVRDSYGADRQQHTFTLRVLRSEGADPLAPGAETRRKGRNVYRNGARRQRWADEDARRGAADEKHGRGDAARAERAARRESGTFQRGRETVSTGPDGRTNRFDQDIEQWQRQIRRILSGAPAGRPLNLGRRFFVLEAFGLRERGLSVAPQILDAVRQKHPDVPETVWLRLPELIADPLYVYRRNGSVSIVTAATTAAGEPIIVGTRNGEIRTVTPRHNRNGERGMDRELRVVAATRGRGETVYVRDDRALSDLQRHALGRQFPPSATPGVAREPLRRQGRPGRILTRDDVIKSQGRIGDVTIYVSGMERGTPCGRPRPSQGAPPCHSKLRRSRVYRWRSSW